MRVLISTTTTVNNELIRDRCLRGDRGEREGERRGWGFGMKGVGQEGRLSVVGLGVFEARGAVQGGWSRGVGLLREVN